MTILGIDPGTAIVGYAVIRERYGKTHLVVAGAIRPKETSTAGRLACIYKEVGYLIDIHRPDMVALEKIFFSKNIKTALAVSEARGVILLTAALQNITLVEYTPLEVKVAATGYGRADKRQVGAMVRLILGEKQVPQLDDVTDAIAIALCALQSRQKPTSMN